MLLAPDRFGYVSLHYVVSLSGNRKSLAEYKRFCLCKAEIQIRSLLQHAWAEIEHDLGYKNERGVPSRIRRRFSRLAGLLELADQEFSTIRSLLAGYAADPHLPTVRTEGLAELVSNVVFTLPPKALRVRLSEIAGDACDIMLALNTPVCNQSEPDGFSDAALTTGRTGKEADGIIRGQVAHANALVFPSVPINDILNREDPTIQISNIRGGAHALGVNATIQGRLLISPEKLYEWKDLTDDLDLAYIRPGLFVKLLDHSMGPFSAVSVSHSTGLNAHLLDNRLKGEISPTFYIQCKEGFRGAFRTASQESTGRPPQALVTQGTRLMVQFQEICDDVDVYVSAGDLSDAPRVEFVETDLLGSLKSKSSGATHSITVHATCMGVPLVPLDIVNGFAIAAWDWTGKVSAGGPHDVNLGVVLSVPPGKLRGSRAMKLVVSFAPLSTVDLADSKAPVPRFAPAVPPKDVFISISDGES